MLGKIIIIKRDGKHGSCFPIVSKLTSIGSDIKCDMRIDNPHISPQHCVINALPHKATIKNLSTERPTLVNGKETGIGEFEIKNGDMITVGHRHFLWSTETKNVFASRKRKYNCITDGNVETSHEEEYEPVAKKRNAVRKTSVDGHVIERRIKTVTETITEKFFKKSSLRSTQSKIPIKQSGSKAAMFKTPSKLNTPATSKSVINDRKSLIPKTSLYLKSPRFCRTPKTMPKQSFMTTSTPFASKSDSVSSLNASFTPDQISKIFKEPEFLNLSSFGSNESTLNITEIIEDQNSSEGACIEGKNTNDNNCKSIQSLEQKITQRIINNKFQKLSTKNISQSRANTSSAVSCQESSLFATAGPNSISFYSETNSPTQKSNRELKHLVEDSTQNSTINLSLNSEANQSLLSRELRILAEITGSSDSGTNLTQNSSRRSQGKESPKKKLLETSSLRNNSNCQPKLSRELRFLAEITGPNDSDRNFTPNSTRRSKGKESPKKKSDETMAESLETPSLLNNSTFKPKISRELRILAEITGPNDSGTNLKQNSSRRSKGKESPNKKPSEISAESLKPPSLLNNSNFQPKLSRELRFLAEITGPNDSRKTFTPNSSRRSQVKESSSKKEPKETLSEPPKTAGGLQNSNFQPKMSRELRILSEITGPNDSGRNLTKDSSRRSKIIESPKKKLNEKIAESPETASLLNNSNVQPKLSRELEILSEITGPNDSGTTLTLNSSRRSKGKKSLETPNLLNNSTLKPKMSRELRILAEITGPNDSGRNLTPSSSRRSKGKESNAKLLESAENASLLNNSNVQPILSREFGILSEITGPDGSGPKSNRRTQGKKSPKTKSSEIIAESLETPSLPNNSNFQPKLSRELRFLAEITGPNDTGKISTTRPTRRSQTTLIETPKSCKKEDKGRKSKDEFSIKRKESTANLPMEKLNEVEFVDESMPIEVEASSSAHESNNVRIGSHKNMEVTANHSVASLPKKKRSKLEMLATITGPNDSGKKATPRTTRVSQAIASAVVDKFPDITNIEKYADSPMQSNQAHDDHETCTACGQKILNKKRVKSLPGILHGKVTKAKPSTSKYFKTIAFANQPVYTATTMGLTTPTKSILKATTYQPESHLTKKITEKDLQPSPPSTPKSVINLSKRAFTEPRKKIVKRSLTKELDALCLEQSKKAAAQLKCVTPAPLDKNKRAALLVCHKRSTRPVIENLDQLPDSSASCEKVTAVTETPLTENQSSSDNSPEDELLNALFLSRKSDFVSAKNIKPVKLLRSYRKSDIIKPIEKQTETYAPDYSIKRLMKLTPEPDYSNVSGINNLFTSPPKEIAKIASPAKTRSQKMFASNSAKENGGKSIKDLLSNEKVNIKNVIEIFKQEVDETMPTTSKQTTPTNKRKAGVIRHIVEAATDNEITKISPRKTRNRTQAKNVPKTGPSEELAVEGLVRKGRGRKKVDTTELAKPGNSSKAKREVKTKAAVALDINGKTSKKVKKNGPKPEKLAKTESVKTPKKGKKKADVEKTKETPKRKRKAEAVVVQNSPSPKPKRVRPKRTAQAKQKSVVVQSSPSPKAKRPKKTAQPKQKIVVQSSPSPKAKRPKKPAQPKQKIVVQNSPSPKPKRGKAKGTAQPKNIKNTKQTKTQKVGKLQRK